MRPRQRLAPSIRSLIVPEKRLFSANVSGFAAVLGPFRWRLGAMGELEPASTAFILICTALVQLMTPGLAFFYGGLVKDTSDTRPTKSALKCKRRL